MNTLLLLLAVSLLGGSSAPWHNSLYLGNGNPWRQRVRVEVSNHSLQAAAGTPVTIKIGHADGDADLVGAQAAAVRVCNEQGDEMLYNLVTPSGTPLRTGAIPEGASITLPVECAASSTSAYYVYYDNPRAWRVPDFLAGGGSLVNGGMELGQGNAPDSWLHDAADSQHKALWSTENSRTGKWCLKTWVAEGAEPSWIATRQGGLRITGGARYVMTAWVKGSGVVGSAGWYIHVGNALNGMLISPMLIGGDGNFDWKQVRAEFTAPADADRAEIGTVLRGTGTAWFDDVQLERLDKEEPLTARADRPERLLLKETTVETAWWHPASAGGPRWEYRTPVRVVNSTDKPISGLVSVRLPDVLTSQQSRVRPDMIRVIAGGKVISHYLMGDTLLFDGKAPAQTTVTYHVYFTADRSAVAASGSAPSTGGVVAAEYAPNPALPGGQTRGAQSMRLRDYAALLGSPGNLAQNASFEKGSGMPDGWSGGAEKENLTTTKMELDPDGLFGKQCVRMAIPAGTTPSWTGWRQDVPVQAGHTYLYAAWLKCQDLQGSLQLYAHLLTDTGALVKQGSMTGTGSPISGTKDWTLQSCTITVPRDCARFQIHLTMQAMAQPGTTGWYWLRSRRVRSVRWKLDQQGAPRASPCGRSTRS